MQKLESHLEQSRGKSAETSFLHDNARPHIEQPTDSELTSYGWKILAHPPYSPDLPLSDYFLFSHLLRYLDGQTFTTKESIKNALDGFLTS